MQQLHGECMQGGDQSVLTSSTSYRKSDNFEVERLSANIWPTITLLQTIWIQIWSQVDIFRKPFRLYCRPCYFAHMSYC